MLDLLQRISGVGRRLAEAGREAREASAVVAGEVTDQMTRALGAAAGEVIRAAVVGAVATVVRGAQRPGHPSNAQFEDPWDDYDVPPPRVPGEPPDIPLETVVVGVPALTTEPRWSGKVQAVGSALTVAAGAAAAMPGGRLVAVGLGAVAAVVGLAARASEVSASD